MKRYLLFASDFYYPLGGWEDFINDFDTIEEARLDTAIDRRDFYQIVDTETKKIVDEN